MGEEKAIVVVIYQGRIMNRVKLTKLQRYERDVELGKGR
jgi:hypothetical protein